MVLLFLNLNEYFAIKRMLTKAFFYHIFPTAQNRNFNPISINIKVIILGVSRSGDLEEKRSGDTSEVFKIPHDLSPSKHNGMAVHIPHNMWRVPVYNSPRWVGMYHTIFQHTCVLWPRFQIQQIQFNLVCQYSLWFQPWSRAVKPNVHKLLQVLKLSVLYYEFGGCCLLDKEH